MSTIKYETAGIGIGGDQFLFIMEFETIIVVTENMNRIDTRILFLKVLKDFKKGKNKIKINK